MNWSDVPRFVEKQRLERKRTLFMNIGYVSLLSVFVVGTFITDGSELWPLVLGIPALVCFSYVGTLLNNRIIKIEKAIRNNR